MSVLKQAMDLRTQNDKEQMMKYNCAMYQRSYQHCVTSMLSPQDNVSFKPVKMVDPALSYQLNPTPESLALARGLSSGSKPTYPPCNPEWNKPSMHVCKMHEPYAYYYLSDAYNPMAGSQAVNYGQNLNMK